MKTSSAQWLRSSFSLAVVLLLAACGGGSPKGSSTGTTAPQTTTASTTPSPTFTLPVEGNWDTCIVIAQSGGGTAYTNRRITLTQLASDRMKLVESFEYNLGAGCTGATGTRNPGDQGTLTLLGTRAEDIGATRVQFTYVSDSMTGTFPGVVALPGTNQLEFKIDYAATGTTQFPAAGDLFQRVTVP